MSMPSKRSLTWRTGAVAMLSLLLGWLTACAAPSPASQPQNGARPTAVGQPVKAPPLSDPLPPERARTPASQPLQLNFSCDSDRDCVVKNVGNCCGEMPACVNQASPTDPQGVQARCSAQDRASVCGFNPITACRCVRNQCVGDQEPVGGWTVDPAPTPPAER